MNREEVIRLAREAGWNGIYSKPLMSITMQEENFLRFAALVAAAEREACAKVCEEDLRDGYLRQTRPIQEEVMLLAAIADCAAAIRARGESK
jgi:hypothetical protein